MRRIAIVAAVAIAACGQNRTSNQGTDGQHVRRSSLEEQQMADPLHRPYTKVLWAAYNLRWCKRDQDKLAITAFAQQAQAESLARSKGMGESLGISRRIQEHISKEVFFDVCAPNFEQAAIALQRAVAEFRNFVVELPLRESR
jgi:hypothetical protein